MDDLISRAAAIEALGERPHNWTDSDSEIAEVCAWESHKSAIENVPAVDAILVEWLEGLMLVTGDDVDKVEFAWIMRKWKSERKEQEGR